MLSHEEATRRLDTLRDPDWLSKAEARADALPTGLRQATRTFLTPIPAFWRADGYEEFRARQDAAVRQLDEAPGEQRAEVMAAIHPRLGPVLDRWWIDARKRPYQRGWGRKAFRAPTFPGMTAWSRGINLTVLASIVGPFGAGPAWLAVWAAHLPHTETYNWTSEPAAIGGLLASAIDLGGSTGDETLAALIEVGNGEHPAGIMGHHMVAALLGSSRPEGWEFVERLLLNAQLQEGLRQAILEAADQGHPEAFDRMLRLLLDRKLLRFPAAVRAAGIWLGFGAHVTDIPLVEDRVSKLAECRASDEARAEAFRSGDRWDIWIALCAGGQRDVVATVQETRLLANAVSPDVRAVALRYAEESGLWFSPEAATAALDDPDLRVASLALSILNRWRLTDPGVFDAIGRLVHRLPATPRTETGLGVEREPVVVSRAAAAASLPDALCGRPAAALEPWLTFMDSRARVKLAETLTGEMPHPLVDLANASAADRQFLIGLLSDRSKHVRRPIVRGLKNAGLRPEEAPGVEALLTSGASGLRRELLTLLASLPPEAARTSAARLAASRNNRQRDAAPELQTLIGADLEPVHGDDIGATVPGDALGPATEAPETADDILASVARGRTVPATPRQKDVSEKPRPTYDAGRARRDIEAIEEIIEQHWNTPVTVSNWQCSQEMLFGDIWQQNWRYELLPVNGHGTRMLLGDVFRAWWRDRPDAGDDACDAFAAYLAAELPGPEYDEDPRRGDKWLSDSIQRLAGTLASGSRLPRYPRAVQHVTRHLAVEYADGAVIDECLDAFEGTLASVPDDVLSRTPLIHQDQLEYQPGYGWRNFSHPWRSLLSEVLHERPDLFTPAQLGRWFRLERWLESPVPDAVPERPRQALLMAAHEAGVATDDDVAAEFLDESYGHHMFGEFTGHWRTGRAAAHPGIAQVAARLRDRLVAVELRRGDLPTATSSVIRDVRSVAGVGLVAELLGKLGKTALTRGGYGFSTDKNDVFSHLVRVCFPAAGESGQDLKAAATAAGVPQFRLVDLALYAPQWARLVEEALGWPGLADGVLWLHAHTRDTRWTVDREIRDSWAALTAERTPVAVQDLLEGAVDVEWFRRAHAALGAERWTVLHKSARHAARGNGHRRAQLYAQAMLGQQDVDGLITKIEGKRDQEAVRALGLVPLPAEPAARRAETQRRYAILREFEWGSDKFGQLRRASEKTAVRIGVENLARVAGYPDPLRFTWAVEAAEAGDLADGPVVVDKSDVTLALSVDAEGTPGLSVARDGRALKSVPAALRKDPDVMALQARKTALAKQAARVRRSLEAAMVAQDVFTPDDFAELRRHPVVAPMLAQLVWVTGDGETRMLGDRLAGAGVPLRIAHPVDLAAEGSWVSWQERLFSEERRQPFKQVFRELYVLTEAEQTEGPFSQRYDGHQVQPRQALALFTARGWVASHESRDAAKTFHRHNLTSRVNLSNGLFTPAEADLPMVEGVGFTRRGEFLLQPLGSVPPMVFSEAMRDLDLVVSVAHAGGVDPEATASTTEMRAALIRETARLLKLGNIASAGDRHVVIKGKLGEYSLHLGSGVVHRRPGGALCIIPVGSQHRGRVFLPFADDDPKTAEIVSKALLLARDHEIKDPTILEQLRS